MSAPAMSIVNGYSLSFLLFLPHLVTIPFSFSTQHTSLHLQTTPHTCIPIHTIKPGKNVQRSGHTNAGETTRRPRMLAYQRHRRQVHGYRNSVRVGKSPNPSPYNCR